MPHDAVALATPSQRFNQLQAYDQISRRDSEHVPQSVFVRLPGGAVGLLSLELGQRVQYPRISRRVSAQLLENRPCFGRPARERVEFCQCPTHLGPGRLELLRLL